MNPTKNVRVFDNKNMLFSYIAHELKRYSLMSNEQHICLSGGSTPKGLYAYLLANDFAHTIQWNNLHFWWGDERCVASEDVQSNYGEAMRLFFNSIKINKQNIHPVAILKNDIAEKNFSDSLQQFIHDIHSLLPVEDNYPVFDWILLGIGDDGHTASLFPKTSNLASKASALLAEKPETKELRISLSANTIRSAKRVSYLVTGESKANVIHHIVTDSTEARHYPAALISSHHGQTEYLLDQQAGSLLNTNEQTRGSCQ